MVPFCKVSAVGAWSAYDAANRMQRALGVGRTILVTAFAIDNAAWGM